MKKLYFGAGVLLLASGCASAPPSGPGVLVLPGSAKSFDQFRFDDTECRRYASAANASGRTLQQRYDFGYQQCMYAKGHKIPMARESAPRTARSGAYPPPPPPPPSN